ncbi:MAG: hypothetical protein HY048_19800 [Acidobacteria bacterium]|nr:hypothetical protein [Acidobacteriota bacterium]
MATSPSNKWRDRLAVASLIVATLALLRATVNYTVPLPEPATILAVTLPILVAVLILVTVARWRTWGLEALAPSKGGWLISHSALFAGRARDVERIVHNCETSSFVLIAGEAGVGKSALLAGCLTEGEQDGLLQALRKRRHVFPILVPSLGGADGDWVTAPTAAVEDAVRAALQQEVPDAFESFIAAKGREDKDPLKFLRAVLDLTGRKPLLLMDQVDDHVLAHSERFMRSGFSITNSELLTNPFWAALDTLLRNRALVCVMVTREPRPVGLESLTKLGPGAQSTIVRQLGIAEAEELLHAMSVKYDMPSTWLPLARRAAAYLNPVRQEPTILPIRLKYLLLALRDSDSRRFTNSRFRKVEQEFLRNRVRAASKSVRPRVSEHVVETMLSRLADAEAIGATISETILFADLGVQHDRLRSVLLDLADFQIVREAGPRWQLNHGYLCEAVYALLNTDRVLAQQANDYLTAMESADGWIEWWLSLPPPLVQLRLMAAHLRGRLNYGPKKLVLAGALRLAFNSLTVPLYALGLLGWPYVDNQLDRRAESIVSDFDSNSAPAQIDALNRFESEWFVQQRVLRKFVERRNIDLLQRNDRYFEYFFNGLSPQSRARLGETTQTYCDNVASLEVQRLRTCGLLLKVLGMPVDPSVAVALLLDDGFANRGFAAQSISPDRRLTVFEKMLPLVRSRSSGSRPTPTDGLCTLLKGMELQSAQLAMSHVIALADEQRSRELVSELGVCRPESLESTDLNDLAETLANQITKSISLSATESLAERFLTLPATAYWPRFSQQVATAVIGKTRKTVSPEERSRYFRLLGRLATRLDGPTVDSVSALVTADVSRLERAQEFQPVIQLLLTVEHPAPSRVGDVVRELTRRIRSQRDSSVAATYAQVGQELSPLLGQIARCEIAGAVVLRVDNTIGPDTTLLLERTLRHIDLGCLSVLQREHVLRLLIRLYVEGGLAEDLQIDDDVKTWSAAQKEETTRTTARQLLDGLDDATTSGTIARRRRILTVLLLQPAGPIAEEALPLGEQLVSSIQASSSPVDENVETLKRYLEHFGPFIKPETRQKWTGAFQRGLTDSDARISLICARLLIALRASEPIPLWERSYRLWLQSSTVVAQKTSTMLAQNAPDDFWNLAPMLPEEHIDQDLDLLLHSGWRNTQEGCSAIRRLIRPLTAARVRDSVAKWPGCQYDFGLLKSALARQGVFFGRAQ